MTKIDHAQLRDVVTVFHVIEAVQELYGDQAADKVTGRAIERAGCMLPGSAPVVASPAPQVPEEFPPSSLDQPCAWWAETGTAGAGEGCNKPFWRRSEAVAYVRRHGGHVAPLFRKWSTPVASHEPASVSGKPAIFVSAEQLDNAAELPSTYLPFRLAPEGKFQTPLYRAAPPAKAEVVDWRDDPAADERWNDGCDFVMQQLCAVLAVEQESVTWEAATETVDGDVQAVLRNILDAGLGGGWRDGAAPPTAPAAARSAAEEWKPTHRHVKSGRLERVIGEAEAQVSVGGYNGLAEDERKLREGDRLTVYEGADGKLRVRFTDEFNDGRFVPLPGEEA